jgi:uncharacterized integral membrane protein (TIGR00697 family)
MFAVFAYIGVLFPSDPSNAELNESYNTLFNYAPRILFASFVAYIVGALLNAGSLLVIKKATGEKLLWLRTIGSTAIGAAADTAIFTVIAWTGVLDFNIMLSMAVVSYVIKMVFETVIATPLDYAIIPLTKKYIMED